MGCSSVIVEGEPTGGSSQSTGASSGSTGGGSGSGGNGAVGCGEGEITVLASGQDQPYAIALDDTNVYWGNQGSGEVMMMPKTGGDPTVFVASTGGVTALAVNATHVYWSATLLTTDASMGWIYETPKAGYKLKKKLASGVQRVNRIAVSDDRIYWTSWDGLWSALKTGGGAMSVLSSNIPGSEGIQVDENRAFWISEYAILSMPKPMGPPVFFEFAPKDVVVFGIDAENLYLDTSEGFAARPKNGGPPVVISPVTTGSAAMAVTDECVYWTTPSPQFNIPAKVGAVRKSGGQPVQFATGKAGRMLIAADETGAYWADSTSGTIMKVSR